MISTFKDLCKVIKKDLNTCCQTLQSDNEKSLEKMEKESKTNHYNKLLQIVRRHEESESITTGEDIKLIINAEKNKKLSDLSRKRKNIVQKEIDKLSDEPTLEELKKILQLVENVKKIQ